MRTFTSRPGLEDRVLSVVPIITNDADAVPSQKGDTDTAEEWIFEMEGAITTASIRGSRLISSATRAPKRCVRRLRLLI